ncbi:MAG: M14 family zinc carboxypeptidase [candidate division WOR-3 bacterium]
MGRAIIVGLTVLVTATFAAGVPEEKEMTVKVFVAPEQIAPIADKVLEFYDVTPEFFTGGVLESSYQELVRQGYRIEVLVPDVRARAKELDAFFHTYEQIRDTWAIIAQAHPNICLLDTIGTSAGGKLMLAMKVSDNPGVMEMEPRICFDFTIHGNENNGTEIAHWVLLQLVNGYGSDPDITRWVNNREIWLLPIVNPDGLISRSRTNSHGVDLNRNYGYSWNGGGPSVFSEPEIQSLYFLGRDNPMAMWSQYHSGTKMAMWPWGYTQLATMDSVVHQYEMVRYSQITGYPYCQISRGLYPVNGGSTDWYYGATGAQGYGIEVCNGQPSQPSEIDTINRANWSAMKEMIQRVMWGISGRVTDSLTGQPVDALVSVNPPDWFTYTDSIGYFHKNLHAGTYSVTVSANGYVTKTFTGVTVPPDTFVFLNVALRPDSATPNTAFQPITNKLGNSNATNAWWALRRRDGRRFSLDKGAWASFDMGRKTPIMNGPGNDFTVVEDDADPEACTVYVSNSWNGPWTRVGFGTGTQGYDLSNAGMQSARFVRIVDDNIGTGGFDIDAIEAIVVNAPMVVYQGNTVIDSPPGGNADGKLDPGEQADMIVSLKNAGRVGVSNLSGKLRTQDAYITVIDSTGTFGTLAPESVRSNNADRFRVNASSSTPREHIVDFTVYLSGTDYADSVKFTITVGALRNVDPIPDGPRQPALYWAYDDKDTLYDEHPQYSWVEVKSVGTRLNFSNNDAVIVVTLPSGFGPFKYYGQRYTQLSISADGWIAPGNYTTTNFSNTELPSTSAPPGAICTNWDDLYPGYGSTGYAYYYHDAANHRFIVEFDSAAYYDQTSLRDKFEIIFYDTTLASPSGNSEFVMQYMTANGYTSSTVGIQDPGRTIGIQCLFNSSYNNGCWPLGPQRAIKYTTDPPTGITETRPSTHFADFEVYPSLSARTLHLRYTLTSRTRIELAVYDRTGRRVRSLVSGQCEPGTHETMWNWTDDDGRKLGAGVYFCRIETAQGHLVSKAIATR